MVFEPHLSQNSVECRLCNFPIKFFLDWAEKSLESDVCFALIHGVDDIVDWFIFVCGNEGFFATVVDVTDYVDHWFQD